MSKKEDYRFEVFEETPKRKNDLEIATLTSAGNIYLNKRFRDLHWSDIQLDYVIFGYDREDSVIRLQTVVDPLPNSYPIREMPNGKGLTVSARAFLNHFGIPFKESRSYEIQYFPADDERQTGPYILINLKKKI